MVIENIRIYKSSGADQIPVHWFKQEVQQYVLRTIAVWSREDCLNSESWLLITYTAFITYLQKTKYNGAAHQLLTQTSKEVYDLVHREVLYNIPIEFVIPKKLVRLIQMCLSKTYNKVQIDKQKCDIFPNPKIKFTITAFHLYFRTFHLEGPS